MSSSQRILRKALLATSGALVFAVVAVPASEAYWVCLPTHTVNRVPDFRCKGDDYNSALSYVQKSSYLRGYGVYRSSSYGGGSVSGQEYYDPYNDFYLQDFYCYGGYPNAHNRHSVVITVDFTLAGSC